MNAKPCVLGLLAVLLTASCATQKLFDDANPRERIWISAKDVSEEKLISMGVKYYKYSDEFETGYLVEKSTVQRLRDFVIRATGVPVTLVVDAATAVSLGGVAVLRVALELDPQGTTDALNCLVDNLLGQR
jgi:hypothetical protein